MSKKALLETIEILVKEEIESLSLKEKIRSSTFNWKEFKALPDIFKMKEYLDATLVSLSETRQKTGREGSARKVYLLSSGKVIKLAKNNAGLAQNEAEASASKTPDIKPAIAKVFDSDPKFFWLVSELVKPLEKSNMYRVGQFFGGDIFPTTDSFEQFAWYVWENKGDVDRSLIKFEHQQAPWLSKYNPNIGKDIKNPKVIAKLNEFFKSLLEFCQKTGSRYEDIASISSFGISAEGNLVVLDYGFTKEVGQKYYDWRTQSDIEAGAKQGYKANLNAK